MNYSEHELDISNARIIELEKNICILQENVTALSEHLKETQRFLIRLAHSQGEVAKRVSTWPFIAVDSRNSDNL